MQINLPSELELFVEQEFATGRYATREEVMILALELLRQEWRQALAGFVRG
jgi:Arc/MetJ-type ribon-helix-helix transcriptional regulator